MTKIVNVHLYETKGGDLLALTERRDGTLGRVIARAPKGGKLVPGPEYTGATFNITKSHFLEV